jgi:hypothetical protein
MVAIKVGEGRGKNMGRDLVMSTKIQLDWNNELWCTVIQKGTTLNNIAWYK